GVAVGRAAADAVLDGARMVEDGDDAEASGAKLRRKVRNVEMVTQENGVGRKLREGGGQPGTGRRVDRRKGDRDGKVGDRNALRGERGDEAAVVDVAAREAGIVVAVEIDDVHELRPLHHASRGPPPPLRRGGANASILLRRRDAKVELAELLGGG